ncbi:MAG: Class peptide chain release factor [Alphaproteobacteria bacterium]|jgi:ribosome-associated protein|nr:Class peptide chain release factor [Alphaproteobacteria bacterium]MDF3033547.1 Class peptide chain release factor [Alphaproteobacteria bacterium]
MQITPEIYIDEKEISESFIRASGPGGQNVNKVSTAVQLRFDIAHSSSLPEEVRIRLLGMVRSRLTKEGVLIITAQRYRSQDQNRQDARRRLADLILRATFSPTKRVPSQPTRASKESRLSNKARRSRLKRGRQNVGEDEE